MARTVVGLFDTFAEAQHVVQDLTNNGVPREDVSLLANDARGEFANYREVGASSAAEGAGVGALGGGALGGIIGALVGIGALAIPGIGPVIAAGPLAAALGSAGAGAVVGAGVGAVSGGLLGALIGAGIPEEDAHYYAEGIRRGGVLVAVNTNDILGSAVYDIMRNHNPVDIKARGEEWRRGGWDRFDPNDKPFEREWEESSKLGTATGTAAGAVAGAAIGSAGGPVGTVVGGVVGAAAGAGVGAAGDVAGEKAEEAFDENDPNHPRYRDRDRR